MQEVDIELIFISLYTYLDYTTCRDVVGTGAMGARHSLWFTNECRAPVLIS